MKPLAAKATPRCELCGREVKLTAHHLLPKAMHRRKRFIALHGKQEMRTRKLMICRLCHNGLHDLLSEKELAESYNTKDLLLAHEGVRRHVEWVKKQK